MTNDGVVVRVRGAEHAELADVRKRRLRVVLVDLPRESVTVEDRVSHLQTWRDAISDLVEPGDPVAGEGLRIALELSVESVV